jgi:lipoprotein signal peptidase
VRRDRYTRLGIVAALLVLAGDQASKWWMLNGLHLAEVGRIRLLPVLDFVLVWNRGVTFGLLNGLGGWSSAALAILALVIVVALGLWLRRAESALTAIALGAIAGGAVGNVIDRVRYGAVVDFIHAHIGEWSWYVFNVGDAAIVCGVAALLIRSQMPRRAEGPDGRNLSNQSANDAPMG